MSPNPYKSTQRLCRWLAVATIGLASAANVWAHDRDNRNHNADQQWVGTWAVSPQTQETFPGFPPPTVPAFSSQTLRQIVHTSIGGDKVRVRLSNTFGTDSLVVGAARVGLRGAAAQIVPGTNKVLTFSGRTTVTIPLGALVVSDPVKLDVPALSDLSISIYLPNPTTGTTLHSEGKQTNYVLAGDQTASTNPTVASTMLMYYFLTNVEVVTSKEIGAIVCLGDSITDGTNSTPDTNHRWPNFLAQRLIAKNGSKFDNGVLDQGISGNRLLHNIAGPDVLSRFDRDVIAQVGATDVILLVGINDIGFGGFLPDQAVSAEDIIAAYRQIITRAHEAGLNIYGGTLTPFAGVGAPYYSDAGEIKRQTVNAFIRYSGEFDGVIDFEAAVRDNQSPPHLLPQYDSGDHLHPSDAGYEAMANAVNLNFFKH